MLPYGFMADIFNTNIPANTPTGVVSQRPFTLQK